MSGAWLRDLTDTSIHREAWAPTLSMPVPRTWHRQLTSQCASSSLRPSSSFAASHLALLFVPSLFDLKILVLVLKPKHKLPLIPDCKGSVVSNFWNAFPKKTITWLVNPQSVHTNCVIWLVLWDSEIRGWWSQSARTSHTEQILVVWCCPLPIC